MGAFNWVTFESTCPACGTKTRIRAQTHIAASYDGDSSGRFHDRPYGLDVVMAWWRRGDRRFDSWTDSADPGHLPSIREACYSDCQDCKADLCAVLEFQDLRATRVVLISLEAAWPEGYLR
jgi:hypothetical protein